MNQKIYFCGSIRGGRADAERYRRMINHIKKTDTVLTEHIGDGQIRVVEDKKYDAFIYEQDTGWLRECDKVIAECTTPSLGVGYELAYAESLGKEIHILYRHRECELSAMLTGNPKFRIFPYETEDEAETILDRILGG